MQWHRVRAEVESSQGTATHDATRASYAAAVCTTAKGRFDANREPWAKPPRRPSLGKPAPPSRALAPRVSSSHNINDCVLTPSARACVWACAAAVLVLTPDTNIALTVGQDLVALGLGGVGLGLFAGGYVVATITE